MRDIDLFQKALGLTPPWQVSASEFNLDEKRLEFGVESALDSIKYHTRVKSRLDPFIMPIVLMEI